MKRKQQGYVQPKKPKLVRQNASFLNANAKKKKKFKGNDEINTFDTALAFTFDATGEIPVTGQLLTILQGDTIANRHGNKIQLKSWQITGNLKFTPGVATTAASTAALFLVWDQQPGSAAPAITDVLTSTGMMDALSNRSNEDRFKILRKWYFPMISQAGVSGAFNNVVAPHTDYGKINQEVIYGASTGAITDLRTGNLFLLAGTDTNSDDTISFAGLFRVNFVK